MKTKVIAVTNQKGGVGKTTTTANLAYALAKKGYDVLAIDFDSQASLTNLLNVGIGQDEEYCGIYELMIHQLRDIEEDEFPELVGLSFEEMCERCICRPSYNIREMQEVDGKRRVMDVPKEFGFDLLPSHLNLSDYELEIGNMPEFDRRGNGFRLFNVVQKIIKWHEYDYILIDCNPSLGVMAMNAITAAVDGVLIPTNLDLMSTRGVGNLINKIADVQEALFRASRGQIRHMGVIGVILNLYAERRTVDKTIQNDLNRFYPFKIFESTIPESVNAKKAVFAGVLYSQTYKKAENAYLSLCDEIIEKMSEMENEGQKIQRIDQADRVGESYEEE